MGPSRSFRAARQRVTALSNASRRLFLRGSVGGGAALLAAASATAAPVVNRQSPVAFLHGVASGDPTHDGVMLWTRITPVDTQSVYEVVCLIREGSAKAPGRVVASQTMRATAARDFTIKIDASGLQPGRHYWYDFQCNGVTSRMGRTRTAPIGDPGRLRFGLVSCSSMAHGYFHAYRLLAQDDQLDAIIHLGDYLYEYATGEYGNVRPCKPAHEILTLSDYRTRHAQYKGEDRDLQDLHARHPFITIWDDHESADNARMDGASNHTEGSEGVWVQRKAWAQQAYDEWMPIRLPEAGNAARIWRRLRYGSLVDLLMLDTRLFGRTLQAATPINPATENVADPARQMIGTVQFKALKQWLQESTATWKLIGNQVVFHQWMLKPGSTAAADLAAAAPSLGGRLAALTAPSGLNGDAWDAYTHERSQIMNVIRGRLPEGHGKPVSNVVFLTGDVHSTWVADIHEDPLNPLKYDRISGQGSMATEFVVTSVTSPGLPLPNQFGQAFQLDNPHIRHINFSDKGYAVLSVTASRVECAYTFVSDVTNPMMGAPMPGPVFSVRAGQNRIERRGLPLSVQGKIDLNLASGSKGSSNR